MAAFNGIGEHAAYSSSKAAVLSISQSLYSELVARHTGIGVSVVCPGMVDTGIHQSWRTRPSGDRAWSDREWNDERHRSGSAAVQGTGVAPQEVARRTLEALREDRFYVFDESGWRRYVSLQTEAALSGSNPRVITWGPDLRPASAKPAP